MVIAVSTKREMDDFVRFPAKLYANSSCYVPDMESDVRAMLNRATNPGLEFSDVQAFVAYDESGSVVGRVAGIINHRANERWHTKSVRFGLLEFADDPDVSAALLWAVEDWGRAKGMERIEGPLGITDLDKEGMLVEDFDLEGSMVDIYNPPYYPRHMEALGYEKEVDWLQVRVDIPAEVPAKYARVARWAEEMLGLRVRKVTRREITEQGYGHKVFRLLNEAFAPLFGYSELSDKQIDSYLKRYLPVIDTQLLSFVENEQGELVGMAVTVRSLSDALRKSGGRMWPTGWFHLLRGMFWKKEDKAEMFLVAIRPDYQGLGVNALFFADLIPIYNRCGIRWAETGPQLETNVRELSQWKPLHPALVKRRRCFKKEL